jgi:hypothetical protein
MARIDIEDQFFDDVGAVAARMGDLDKAHGQAIRLLRWAQMQIKSDKPTTLDEFKRKGFSEALAPEFVTIDGDLVRVRGADNHFAWLKKKQDAGREGGKKSGEARRSKSKQTEARPSKRSKSKQTEGSFSSSSSSSSSFSGSSTSKVPTEPTASGAANDFIAAYCQRFKIRWGVNPPIQGKDAGIAGRLAKGLSAEKRDLYLDAYFSMPDAWIVKAKHPINLFETKLNEISVFAQSGEFHTQRQAREADSSATNAMLLAKLERGEI